MKIKSFQQIYFRKNKVVLILAVLITVIFGFSFLKNSFQPIQAQSYNTYYISPTGSDSNSGTNSAPWKTFDYAFRNGMKGGDTLILKDGIYTESIGYQNSSAPYNSWSPPNGSVAAYTIIKAENDGQAIIKDSLIYIGGAINGGVANGSFYVQIEGLKLLRSVIDIRNSHHIKVFRTGVKNGVPIDSRYGQVIVIHQNSHHVLLEDVWVIGTMRYGVLVSESYNVILRRVVARFDGNSEREPKSGISFYGATDGITGAYDSICQNCIALDYNAGSGAGMYVPHSGKNIKFYGSIALNLPANGILLNEDGISNGNDVINSVAWDLTIGYGIAMRDGDPSKTTLIDQVTVGNTLGGTAQWSGSAGTNVVTTIKNSIFYNNQNANAGGDVSTFNWYYPASQSQGTNVLTTNPNIQYILRSPDTGTGESGVKRGATIEKRYGVDGTLWGESGYNQLTNVNLWPWSNEQRIRDDAAEADGFSYPTTKWDGSQYTVVNNPVRGFAADGNGLYGGPITLTSYIWEYFGNACPSDICNYGSADTTAPSTVNNLSVSSCTYDSCTLSWTSPGDDNNTGTASSYDIRHSTSLINDSNWDSAIQATGEPNPQISGSTQTFTITGLTASTVYYFAIKTLDEIPNTSAISNSSSGMTLVAANNIYYISPAGSDSNSGTSAAPWKTFTKAFSVIKAGDELILLDGTYTGDTTGYMHFDNLSFGGCSPNCAQIPSGTSLNNMTYVHAQNPGNVKIIGGLFIGRSFRKDSYIKVEGINFEGGGQFYNTSYVTLKNCGIHKNGSGGAFTIGTNDHKHGNSYNLIEDCWFWAIDSRVIIGNYRSDNNVWRRVVVRGDGSTDAGPNVGFTVYDSSNVSVQNMIIADRILNTGAGGYADFATAQHTDGAHFLGPAEWLGSISLKAPDNSFAFEGDNTNDNTITLKDCVAWDPAQTCYTFQTDLKNCLFENLTAYCNGTGNNFRFRNTSFTARNLVGIGGNYIYNSGAQCSYLNAYGWTIAKYYSAGCSTGEKTTDPRNDGTPQSLKYLVRIEDGSVLKGTGYGGADYGANIVNRYGINGSRYGETNYNTLTSNSLWPWPNEDRIKKEMCTDVGITRGFCSKSSLTRYIWEYLGNACPSDICNYGSTPLPAPSITLTKQADQSQVQEGDDLTYTIIYQNISSVEVKNIVITDNIPEGSTYIEGSATNGGTYDSLSKKITWIILSLEANTSDDISFKVQVGEKSTPPPPPVSTSGSPVLYFSDLIDGPKIGWEGSKKQGAAVSILGNNFGSTRGDSSLSVCGITLDKDSDFAEWGVTTNNARGMERITFWLNSDCTSGLSSITINVDETTSNALPFYVRDTGAIYFVSKSDGSNTYNGQYDSFNSGTDGPFLTIAYGRQKIKGGDILYIRNGIYNEGDAYDSILNLDSAIKGAENNYTVFAGYPGEFPILDGTVNGSGGVIRDSWKSTGYIVFSKMKLLPSISAIKVGGPTSGYYRFIGLEMDGQGIYPNRETSVGCIDAHDISNIIVFGCTGHNWGYSKYDHGIYIGYNNDGRIMTNFDIGWNEFNNLGPDVSGIYIHPKDTDPLNGYVDEIDIHDNLCHDLEHAGIHIAARVEDVRIYNNIIYNCGSAAYRSPLYITLSNAHIPNILVYNNTIYSAGKNSLVHFYGLVNVTMKNNIFYSLNSTPYVSFSNESGNYSSTNDLWYGNGVAPSWATNALNIDPQFIDTSANDFHLQETSPAIDAGTDDVSSIVIKDYDGVSRPQGSGYDIGAYER